MPLDIVAIESFFEARFEPMDTSLSDTLWPHYFDGFVHWCLIHAPKDIWLSIQADFTPGPNALPLVEVTMSCERIVASQAEGMGPVLIFLPPGSSGQGEQLWLYKTKEGRISLATTLIAHKPDSATC